MKSMIILLLVSTILLSSGSVSPARIIPDKESKIKAVTAFVPTFTTFVPTVNPVGEVGRMQDARHTAQLPATLYDQSVSKTALCDLLPCPATGCSVFKDILMREKRTEKRIVIPLQSVKGTATYSRHPNRETIAAVNAMAKLAYTMVGHRPPERSA